MADPPAVVTSAEGARRLVADAFEARIDAITDEACASYRRELPEFAELALTRYRDVCLELVALSDEVATRMLADAELAELEGDDATTVKLRRTLLAYFESGQNAASTAARLGVNDQTVARHLRTVRERIGCYPQDRRAELELALRYRRLLEESIDGRRGLGLDPAAVREL